MVPLAICFTLIKYIWQTVLNRLRNLFGKPEEQFKDKVAIVTGSSRGIGRAIAKHLCASGAKVVLNGLNQERLRCTYDAFAKEGWKVTACQADVSNSDDCSKLVNHAIQKFGKIDILVNNVGIGSRGFFENTCPEVFRQLLCANVLGSVFPTIAALPFLKKTRGSILFISSLAGLRGLPNLCPYSMTKMAQTSLAESLRTELFREHVHVGIVYAGKTENDPEKKILRPDGKYRSVKMASQSLVDSRDQLAKAVLKGIQARKFKITVGVKGMLFYFVQKFMPWLVEFTVRKKLDDIKYDVT